MANKIQNTDTFIVNRSNKSYQVKAQDLLDKIRDNDLMLVNRSNKSYKASGSDIKDSLVVQIPPVINTVTLTESNPDSNQRFTSQEFVTEATMLLNGEPASSKTIDAYVEGSVFSQGSFNAPLESVTAGDTDIDNSSWTYVDPGTTNENTQKRWNVRFLNGKFYSVGLGGITSSVDGQSWEGPFGDTTKNYRDIAYGNGLYVVVGWDGAIASSIDGENWEEQGSPFDTNYEGVAYGDGRWVAVGTPKVKNQEVVWSDDGMTWVAGTGVNSSFDWRSVIKTPTQWLMLSSNGSSTGAARSSDGKSWTKFNPSSLTGFQKVVMLDNGDLIATSTTTIYQALKSTDDGNTWNTAGLPAVNSQFYGVAACGPTVIVNGGSNRIYKSTDYGASWDTDITNHDNNWIGAAYGNGRFVLVSANTTAGKQQAGYFDYVSTKLNFAAGTDMTYAPTGVLAKQGATEQLINSREGTSLGVGSTTGWTVGNNVTTDLNKTVQDGARKYLQFDGSGNVTSLLTAPQQPAYSTNAESPSLTLKFPATFPSGQEPDTELLPGTALTTVVTAENQHGTDAMSATVQPRFVPGVGEEWVTFDLSGIWINDVTYGYVEAEAKYRWVVVGSSSAGGTSGAAYWSDDAVTWTRATMADSNKINPQSVRSSGAGFACVGNKASAVNVMYSADGKTWTIGQQLSSGGGVSTNSFTSLVALENKGHYLAFSVQSNNTGTQVYKSENNGQTFRAFGSVDINFKNMIKYNSVRNGDTIVAVAGGGASGNGPTIYTSTDGGDTWPTNQWYEGAQTFVSRAIVYDGTQFITYGAPTGTGNPAKVYTSPDGLTWTDRGVQTLNPYKNMAVNEDGISLVVSAFADNGTQRNAAQVTSNGITWDDLEGPPGNTYLSMAYGGGYFVTGGYEGVAVSPNPALQSMSAAELKSQKQLFATYNNRKEVVEGASALAARSALSSNLIAEGYTSADVEAEFN